MSAKRSALPPSALKGTKQNRVAGRASVTQEIVLDLYTDYYCPDVIGFVKRMSYQPTMHPANLLNSEHLWTTMLFTYYQ